MPLFIGHNHLLHNLLYVFVGSFHCAIHLRSLWRRVVMLYLELLAEFGHHLIVEICTIIRNDPFWYTVSTDQIVSEEPRHDVLGYYSKRSCLNPLRKIINSHPNETMPVICSRYDLPNHVDAPHCKRPRCCQDVQRNWRNVHLISIDLTLGDMSENADNSRLPLWTSNILPEGFSLPWYVYWNEFQKYLHAALP